MNHGGDVAVAHRMIDAVAGTGADAVKFQTWVTELICAPDAALAPYQRANDPTAVTQFQLLKSLELPVSAWAELKGHAESVGLVFLSTPDDSESARLLVDLGVGAIKIGSGEVTNHEYLAFLAGLGRPLILSTGMSSLRDVEEAVEVIRTQGDPALALLHCVSSYPAPEAEMNLLCIRALRERFDVPTGLSDHSMSDSAAVISVGLGLSLLEKHVTLDRSLPGPDQACSYEPAELTRLVAIVRKAEVMLGTGEKRAADAEEGTRQAVRRLLYFSRDLPAGAILEPADLVALRGVDGVPACRKLALMGRRILVPAKRGDQVHEEALECGR